MDFRFRENEINEINRLRWLSEEQYTRVLLLTGPMYVGKTSLIMHALGDKPILYCNVGNKSETLLCEEFLDQASRILGMEVHDVSLTLDSFIDALFEHSELKSFSVIFDEFQKLPEYALVHLSEVLKTRKRRSNLNIILLSSDEIMSEALSVPEESVLFNCVDSMIVLEPFSPSECKTLYYEKHPDGTMEEFLKFYAVTGGVPYLVDMGLQFDNILSAVYHHGSVFLDYGYRILDPVLGKNSEVYYSILQAMANGCESQASIEKKIGYGLNVGGHLAKLEMLYGVVYRARPIYSPESARGVVRYGIKSQSLEFWFRWIETYRSFIEAGEFDVVTDAFNKAFKGYSLSVLRRYFRKKLVLEGGYSKTAGWWTPISDHSNTPDIPVVATNASKQVLAADICYCAEDFEKEVFLGAVSKLKRVAPRGVTVNPVLFTISDM